MEWDRIILGNSVTQWAVALGIAVAALLLATVVKSMLVRRLKAYASRTVNRWDDALVITLDATRHWLLLIVAVHIGTRSLALPARVDAILHDAAIIAIFAQLGIWASAAIAFYVARPSPAAAPLAEHRLSALGIVARGGAWAAIILLALSNLGINVSALLAGLGVGGIAVALAVQNILGDLFASLSILLDKPFETGDFVIVDDYLGSVEHIGIKTTRLRSLSGEQLVFANGDLLKARLRNYKRMRERRALMAFRVPYETPVAALGTIPGTVQRIVEAQPGTRFERAHFKGFGTSSLDYEVVYWMTDPDFGRYMDTQQAINLALMQAFAADGIEFAYPAQRLHLVSPVPVRSAAPGAP